MRSFWQQLRGPCVGLAMLGLVMAWGCGDAGPKTYPAEGKVVFQDGKPFPGGVIELESLDQRSGPGGGLPLNARGAINDDGTFRLTTFKDGDGAVAGRHRAMVRQIRREFESGRGQGPAPVILDSKFEKYETSGLEFTVKEEKNNLTVTVNRPRQ